MKAAVYDRYCAPSALELREAEQPQPADDELLVRVRAAAVNPLDCYRVTGTPYVLRFGSGVLRPKTNRLGVDFAGVVEAVGVDVGRFRVGDEVFGGRTGAFAEYVCVREEGAVAQKPQNLTFEEAAAVPVAALTALQGLRDHGGLQPGQHVLINGASGGVGTFAVQIAKVLGAEVTAVCSTRNVEVARSLGADRVVDYTSEDFTRGGARYDLLLDIAGSRSWREYERVLAPEAAVVIVGAARGGRLLGPLTRMLGLRVAARRSSRRLVFFMSDLNRADLETVCELLAAGTVKPVVECRYELARLADALRHVAAGHARGKIVLTV